MTRISTLALVSVPCAFAAWIAHTPGAMAQAQDPTAAGEVGVQAEARGESTGAGTVKGSVIHEDTGIPVVGATVILVGTNYAAITEADGSFAIEGVPAGTYQVQASSFDNARAEASLVVQAGQTATLDLTAATDQNAGEVIVVTGTRSPEKVFDSPITIESISEETLATTAGTSLYSALADVKGIDVTNVGIGEQRISARGFTTQFNSRMITLVDGRLATLPGAGLPQGNLLPTAGLDVKAMEVVVGPASALYGPNAHTGVINILTKTPWDQPGVSVAVRGGTQDMLAGSLRLAGTYNQNLGWKINMEYFEAEEFQPDRAASTHYYSTDDATRFPVQVFEGDIIESYDISAFKLDGSVYYKYDQWYFKGTAGRSLTDGFALTNVGRNHIQDWEVQYQAAQISHPNWYAQFTRTTTDAGKTYQLDNLARLAATLPEEQRTATALNPLRESVAFIDSSQLIDGEIQHRNEIRGFKVALGTQWRTYMPDSGGTYLADARGEDIDATEIGGYAQVDYSLLPGPDGKPRLRLVGAARVDDHTNYTLQLSPSLLAVYTVHPQHKIRAGLKRAFKTPTVLENYLTLNDVLLGNRDGYVIRSGPTADSSVVAEIDGLEPETANVVEVGYKGSLGRLVFIDAVIHSSWYDNFISPLTQLGNPLNPDMATFAFTPDGDLVAGNGFLFTYQNFGKAHVLGADVGASVYPNDNVTLSLSGSWISLRDFTNDNATQSDLLLNVPEFKLKGAVAIKDLGLEGYFVRLTGRYRNAHEFVSGYWNSNNFTRNGEPLFSDGKIPSRFVADLSAGYTIPGSGITISGFVTNLLNTDTLDLLGAPIVERLAFVQMSYKLTSMNY